LVALNLVIYIGCVAVACQNIPGMRPT